MKTTDDAQARDAAWVIRQRQPISRRVGGPRTAGAPQSMLDRPPASLRSPATSSPSWPSPLLGPMGQAQPGSFAGVSWALWRLAACGCVVALWGAAACQSTAPPEAEAPVQVEPYSRMESLAPPAAELIPLPEPTRQLYVDAAAAPGGDGSASKPLQSVDAAWALVGAAADTSVTQVVLAAGRYEVSEISEGGGWWLRGASPEETSLHVTAPKGRWSVSDSLVLESLRLDTAVSFVGAGQRSALALRGVVAREHEGLSLETFAQVELKKVTLTRTSGLSAQQVQALRFDELSVHESVGTAVTLFKTRATGRRLNVVGVSARGGQGGDGVSIVRSALSWREGRVEGAEDRALAIKYRSEADVEGVSLESKGRAAFYADVDSRVTLRRASMRGAVTCTLMTSGAALTLEDADVGPCLKQGVVLRDKASGVVKNLRVSDCPGGHVSVLGRQVRLEMSGSRLSGAQDICVLISASDGPVRFTDNKVSGCKGSGIAVLRGRDVVLSKNSVEAVEAGLTVKIMAHGVSLVDSEVVLEGNVIQRVSGLGVSLLRSEGRLIDNEVRHSGSSGINLVGLASAGAQIEIRGNTVEDTGGPGVMAAMEVNATIKGNAFNRNLGGGVRVMPGVGEVVVEDNENCDLERAGDAP